MGIRFGLGNASRTPHMTPYRSGLPIDSVPPPDKNDPDQARRTTVYQSLVGCLNWLAVCSRPDLATVVSFLASFMNKPSNGHYSAAVYALRYALSTSSYGVSFQSEAKAILEAFFRFPHAHDTEAYSDAAPPLANKRHELTAYADACWGNQVGNSVPDGTELELFKFRSMSGHVITRCGGPVLWKAKRQERTSRSSCEAEIYATDECAKDTLSLRHRANDLGFEDAKNMTTLFNDNQGCVDW